MLKQLTQLPRMLLGLLVVAAVLRIGIAAWKFDNLTADVDRYGAIAANLLDGNGFCTEIGKPTAFRPPLYPFLIAACGLIGGTVIVAAAHVLLGTATVGMTWRLSQRLGLSPRACLAVSGLAAVDPLLLLYSSHLMTETLFTFLVTGLLLSLHSDQTNRQSATFGMTDEKPAAGKQATVAGCWFGLAALCRPTIWAFGILAGACVLAVALRRRLAGANKESVPRKRPALIFGVTVLAVVSPWIIRNWVVLGHPTVMTTHGGYTILLGNNPVFYDEVVADRRQSVWSGDSLGEWQQSLEVELSAAGAVTERDRSRHLQQMAVDWIWRNPGSFFECAWLRVRRLWSPGPENSSGIPQTISVTIRRYYQVTYLLVLAGLIRHRNKWRNVWILLAFLASLTLLHSVYWANARMRAPAIPVVSILAVAVFSHLGRESTRRDLPQVGIDSCPLDENPVNRGK